MKQDSNEKTARRPPGDEVEIVQGVNGQSVAQSERVVKPRPIADLSDDELQVLVQRGIPRAIDPSFYGGATHIDVAFFDDPTDVLARDVVLDRFNGSVIHEYETGRFWEKRADESYYRPVYDILNRINLALDAAIRAVHADRIHEAPKGLGKQMDRAFSKARSAASLRAVEGLLAERLNRVEIPWNTVPDVFPTVTGVLDFTRQTPYIRAARSNEYFRDPLPIAAVDILNAGTSEPWERFKAELFPNSKTRETARFLLAMMIRGKAVKTFQIWHNPGFGGKNSLTDLLAAIYPNRIKVMNGALVSRFGDTSERRFAAAEGEGRTAWVFDEISGVFDVPAIKRFTSLSPISIERKREHPRTISPTWAPVVLTNELPDFNPPDDQAFLSRLFVLPFNSVFYANSEAYDDFTAQGISPEHLHPARDKDELLEELTSEAPAILSDLMSAAIALREKHSGRPPESPECRAARKRYRVKNDFQARFVAEYLVLDPDGFIPNDRLDELYREFSGDPRAKTKDLRDRLEKRYTQIESGRKRVFVDGMSKLKRGLLGIRERTESESTICDKCDSLTEISGSTTYQNSYKTNADSLSQRHTVTKDQDDGEIPLQFQGGDS